MLYSYKCGICGHVEDLFRKVEERDNIAICEECGGVAKKIFAPTQKRFAESRPFWSHTMGCHPEQVADERRRHPDWTIRDDGRVLVEGLKDQRKKVKELGMVNFDDN